MRLKQRYEKEIRKELQKKLGLKNIMATPKIEKVCVNVGFGREVAGKGSSDRQKIAERIAEKLGLMTGQKPSLRKAKKSIASFKLREGVEIGASVTLRGKRMYEFLEKLIYVVLPRKRDFRGISLSSIDEQGNLTLGFKEYTPFPEVKIDKGLFGLELSVKTTAENRAQAIELFRLMGFPLKENG